MTIRNLHGLLEVLTTSEEIVQSQSSSARMKLPVAPAVLSGLAPARRFSRGTPKGSPTGQVEINILPLN